jgi:endonuclease YncB( thermonuclease family)
MYSPRSHLSLLVALLLLLSVSPSHSAASILEDAVVKITDGDTIIVLDSDEVQHRVHIAGIDAPEKGQAFGNASRKRLTELVARKEVRVEFNKQDRYGRIVGKVLVKPPDCPTCGKTLDVGLVQITTGMAWWYRKYAREQSPEDQGRYEFAEQEAKAKKVGLWQDKNPQPPWEFRKGRKNK